MPQLVAHLSSTPLKGKNSIIVHLGQQHPNALATQGVVHKQLLQEVGRWCKNVHFLSIFIPQKMSMEGGPVGGQKQPRSCQRSLRTTSNNLATQYFSNPMLWQPNTLAMFFYCRTGQYAIVACLGQQHVSVSSMSQLIAPPKQFKIEFQISLLLATLGY